MTNQQNPNWYLRLELSVDPPVNKEQDIREAIDKKMTEWQNGVNHPKKGAEYRDNLTLISKTGVNDICALLLAPNYQPVQASSPKSEKTLINESMKNKIMERCRMLDEALKKQGKEKSLYEKYYERFLGSCIGWKSSCREMHKLLADSVYSTPYDLLGINNGAREVEIWVAHEKKYQELKVNGLNTGNKQQRKVIELLGQVKVILDNMRGLYPYDAWCVYNVLDSLKKNIKDKRLNQNDFSSKEKEIQSLIKPSEKAHDLLLKFCEKHSIDAECVPCPVCGKFNYQSGKKCIHCGAPMKGTKDAEDRYKKAQEALNRLAFDDARKFLSDAMELWENVDTENLEDKIRSLEKELGGPLKELGRVIAEKRYCRAKEIYQELQKKSKAYRNDNLQEDIEQELKEAFDYLEKAKKIASKENLTDQELRDQAMYCAKAKEHCTDLDDIDEYMPPPKSVEDFRINFKEEQHSNFLSWKGLANDVAIEYVVVRSEHGPINDCKDGMILWQGEGKTQYEDNSILSKVSYYYNVFVKRGNKYSKGAKNSDLYLGAQCHEVPVPGLRKVKDVKRCGNNLVIWFSPADIPIEAVGFCVEELSDTQKTRPSNSSEVIPLPCGELSIEKRNVLDERRKYTFLIWTQCGFGEKREIRDFSKPLQITFDDTQANDPLDDIVYSFSVKKKLIIFGRPEKITLSFHSKSSSVFQMPDLDIRWQKGRQLLRTDDGYLLGKIKAMPQKSAMWTEEILLPADLPDDVYIGIFSTSGKKIQLRTEDGMYCIS